MEMMQLIGLLTCLVGWVGNILICALPMWRVTSVLSSNGMAGQSYTDGLWVTCANEGMGQLQCRSYNSVLEITPDLIVARVIVVFSLVMGFIGLLLSFLDREFVSCMGVITKNRYIAVTGTLLLTCGFLILIPVSWSASNIINNFFSPMVSEAVSRELGASLYIGWISAAFLVIGGMMLCRLGTQCQQNSYLKSYKGVKTCSPTGYPMKDYV